MHGPKFVSPLFSNYCHLVQPLSSFPLLYQSFTHSKFFPSSLIHTKIFSHARKNGTFNFPLCPISPFSPVSPPNHLNQLRRYVLQVHLSTFPFAFQLYVLVKSSQLCFLFLVFKSFVLVGCVGNALHALRTRLSDPNNVLQSWDPTLVNPCTWFHVTCDSNNHVTRL